VSNECTVRVGRGRSDVGRARGWDWEHSLFKKKYTRRLQICFGRERSRVVLDEEEMKLVVNVGERGRLFSARYVRRDFLMQMLASACRPGPCG
jgi:hypothetical protein